MSDLKAAWHDLRDRLCFRTERDSNLWAWGGSCKLDLHHLVVTFGDFAPTHFRLQVSDSHVAVRIFDDVLLIGVSQLTEAAWSCIYCMHQASQEAALRELAWAASLAIDGAEPKGADDAGALH